MRDIRADLQDRADRLKQQINAAQDQFEQHCEQLKREQSHRLADLGAQLDAVRRLITVATWHQNIRSVMAAAVKTVTVAADVTKAACRPSAPQTVEAGGPLRDQRARMEDTEKP